MPKGGPKDAGQDAEEDRNIALWKTKNLIKRLNKARGNGTSLITLIIPPKDQISRVSKMLADEFGTASNIKSRTTKQAVLSAITSTQYCLKLHKKVPPNGLVVYCGNVWSEEGKEKKMSIHFEPFRPINTSMYLCDNKFHTECLNELLESDQSFGFIVMDGNGCLYGTLSGNTRKVMYKFGVELPKKHGRGGQSAVRFARLRTEARHNYVRKCAEESTRQFITNDKPNVIGLVLAGSAAFKNDLFQSDLFDNRLKPIVIKIVDVSYGGENGFNQAIELAAETLSNVKFIAEKKLLGAYMQEIAKDTGRYCFGLKDSLLALEMGACETLIVWDSLDTMRYSLKNPSTSVVTEIHVDPKQKQDDSLFMDKTTGVTLDVVEQVELIEWLANHYKDFGTTLEFVTNRSQEGSQFVKGFGGIGCLLRYKVDFATLDEYMDEEQYEDDEWI